MIGRGRGLTSERAIEGGSNIPWTIGKVVCGVLSVIKAMVWILVGRMERSVGFFAYVRQETPIIAQNRNGERLWYVLGVIEGSRSGSRTAYSRKYLWRVSVSHVSSAARTYN